MFWLFLCLDQCLLCVYWWHIVVLIPALVAAAWQWILLHSTWVIDDMKCILVTCVCVSVSLSLTAFPHYCMDSDITWGMVGVPPSCALLGRFAIGARVSLLWQHSTNAKWQRVLVLALCLVDLLLSIASFSLFVITVSVKPGKCHYLSFHLML